MTRELNVGFRPLPQTTRLWRGRNTESAGANPCSSRSQARARGQPRGGPLDPQRVVLEDARRVPGRRLVEGLCPDVLHGDLMHSIVGMLTIESVL